MSSPVYGVYARPTDVKAYSGLTGTADDDLLLELCIRARAKVDSATGRHFWPKAATVLYDVPESTDELEFARDLVSVTTLTNGNSVAIESDEYFLYPTCGPPYAWLVLDTSQGICWEYAASRQQCISLVGIWGWDEIIVDSGATLNAGYTADGTSITPNSVSAFAVGDMLKIGDEYQYVTVVGETTLTVQPGINGSTSADHALATAINFVRFPDGIVRIATRLATWYYRQKDAPFEKTAMPELGVLTVPASLPPDIKADLQVWTR